MHGSNAPNGAKSEASKQVCGGNTNAASKPNTREPLVPAVLPQAQKLLAAQLPSATRSIATTPKSYKSAKIWRSAEGDWKTDLDRESTFDSEGDVKRFVDAEKKNPGISVTSKRQSAQIVRDRKEAKRGLLAAWDNGDAEYVYVLDGVRHVSYPRSMTREQMEKLKADVKRNPEDAAADKYEEFHGKPSGEEVIVEEEYRYHENLAALGDLCQIKCRTVSGYDASFDFCGYNEKTGAFDETVAESERPILCCSEDGRQLYVLGGDQALDLGEIKMDSGKWPRDSMVIGEAYMVTYQTAKGFDEFETVSYFHELGEDTGVPPQLVFDKLNDQIQFVGGQYEILPEDGDAKGLGGSIFN